jgi:hypothetical protein
MGSQVRALVRMRKPEVSDTTPNRAFPRGFSATQFPDLGLRGRSYIFGAVFGALSPHQKIPFPAAVVEREVGPHCTRNSEIWATVIRDFGPALQLFRVEPERLELPAPFDRWITEPLDADAAGQTAFDGCLDQIGC